MNCPCKECICLAVCKHKMYIDLIKECLTVQHFLPDSCDASCRSDEKLKELYDTIQPSKWIIIKYDNSYQGFEGKFYVKHIE